MYVYIHVRTCIRVQLQNANVTGIFEAGLQTIEHYLIFNCSFIFLRK